MTLNCNGKILDFSTKKIMGIVNISKDSFFSSIHLPYTSGEFTVDKKTPATKLMIAGIW